MCSIYQQIFIKLQKIHTNCGCFHVLIKIYLFWSLKAISIEFDYFCHPFSCKLSFQLQMTMDVKMFEILCSFMFVLSTTVQYDRTTIYVFFFHLFYRLLKCIKNKIEKENVERDPQKPIDLKIVIK